jgi:hypothetical protein
VKILAKYVIKFWFEHGGICLWSVNDNAKDVFGYAINNKNLPISKSLVDELCALEEEYYDYLDWDYPLNPSPWTQMQKHEFKNRANVAYFKLLTELGNDYKIINDIDSCIV